MDATAAQELIQSRDSHTRLKAARYFENSGEIDHIDVIAAALAREDVSRIKTILSKTLKRLRESAAEQISLESDQIDLADEIYSRALRETTRMLLHELRPIVGALAQRAKNEIPAFNSSQTSRQVDRLMSLLDGFDRLAKAASSAKFEEFDLAELVRDISKTVNVEHIAVRVEQIGQAPLIVLGDPSLVYLIVSNGLRNAIEAGVEAIADENSSIKIIVAWGETDIDYWISIADRGPGLPVGSDQIWEIGSTNKKDHLGMGLAIAKQAAKSLQGTITLTPRAEGGAAFEFRWAKRKRENHEASNNRG